MQKENMNLILMKDKYVNSSAYVENEAPQLLKKKQTFQFFRQMHSGSDSVLFLQKLLMLILIQKPSIVLLRSSQKS